MRNPRPALPVLVALLCALLPAARSTPVLAQTGSLALLPGWNNIAYLGPAEPVLAGLSPIAGGYDALWRYDAADQVWRSFNPKVPEASDFSDLTQGAAYWIHMTKGAILSIGLVGTASSSARALSLGWNNVVQTGVSAAVSDALSSHNATYTVVWHWNAGAQRWEMYSPTAPAISEFRTLVQGQAYWVQVTAPSPGAPSASTSCYQFSSYQPLTTEVLDVLGKAGNNSLLDDAGFRLPNADTALDNGTASVAGYIPPTLLKATAWIESSWLQATYSVPRGGNGTTLTSRTCAYGLLQVLTGMSISGTPTPRQQSIGSDYLHNVAAGAQIMLAKWNMAPTSLPVYGRRDPHVVEDWYFATWAYHCYGDMCARYSVHDNPDDPTLKWPRPSYGSPPQTGSGGSFSATDYPYQELVFGLVAYPPSTGGVPPWQAIPLVLPPHGSVGFPVAHDVNESSAHLDSGASLTVNAPLATPTSAQSPLSQPSPTSVASGSLQFPGVGR